MKRICFVVNNFDVGGLEKVVISLINNINKNNFKVYLVCLSDKGKLFDEINIHADCTLILHKRNGFDFNIIPRIRNFFISNKIDIVHAHNFGPLIYSGVAHKSIFRKKPILFYTEHNQVYRQILSSKFRTKLYIKLADKVITVSNKLKEFYSEELNVTNNVLTIYNGINKVPHDTIPLNRGDLGVDIDCLLVGTAVVLSKQKGINNLIDAADIVKKKLGNRVQFVIAGHGDLRDQLEEMSITKKLDDIVKFIGYRQDVHNLIKTYDIYILSSLWEGLPLSLLEALSAGKPIIATNVGGNTEIVEDGINGIIVEPASPQQLADAIFELYAIKEKLNHYNDVNISKFDEIFSLKSMIENHEKLYLLN
ncbi:MAG: glycosyltransferase [Gammaproteobacteria bacterium]|nr:glycosyltransferase [Gammaproteobacteria bacterium]